MSEQIGSNGNELTITIPSSGEKDWSVSIRDNCFALISAHTHQGAGTGAKLKGYLALDLTEAIVTNDTALMARNAAGSSTVAILKVDANDELVLSSTVSSAEFQDDGLTVVDNGDNTKKIALDASAITTATTRTLTMADANVDLAALDNTNIASGAAIDVNKLAALTSSRAAALDASGFLSAATTTLAELNYLSGVTSGVQAQLNTKTDTGTANEITLTGTTIGLADNPTIPGTGSMVVPKGTEAQRTGSPVGGEFRFNSDNSTFEGYDGSAWGQVGGSGGGLDSVDTEDFEGSVDASTVLTGNNAAFDGGGTIDGAVADETSSPISGTTSLKYTAGSSSTNDYVVVKTVTLASREKGEWLGITLYADMSNFSANADFVVKTNEGDILTTSGLDVLTASTSKSRYSFAIYVPSTASSLEYGIHMVNAPTNTETIILDMIEVTTNPFVYKNLTQTESYRVHTLGGYGSTATYIPYFTTTIKNTISSLGTVSNDSTNGWSFTASKKCVVSIEYSQDTTTTQLLGFSLDASDVTDALSSQSQTEQVARHSSVSTLESQVSANIEMEVGQVLRPHATTLTTGTTSVARLNMVVQAQSEHVITPAKSNITPWEDAGTTVITGTSSDPTKGTTSLDRMLCRRNGNHMDVRIEYRQTGAGSAGSGSYIFDLTKCLTALGATAIDLDFLTAYSTVANFPQNSVGNGAAGDSGSVSACSVVVYDSTKVRVTATNQSTSSWVSSTIQALSQANLSYGFNLSVPISGWTSDATFLAAVPTSEFVQPGTILPFAGETAPTGYLVCDGSTISRSSYSALYAAIGDAHGYGDNSTTFEIPDLRGRFLRGHDNGAGNDSGAGSRTAAATGGNTGDTVGSYQEDGNKDHNHINGLHSNDSSIDSYGQFSSGSRWRFTSNGTSTAGTYGYYTSTTSDGESRPKNINVNYIIKY